MEAVHLLTRIYLKIGKLKLVFEMTVMYHWCMVNLTDMNLSQNHKI